MDLQPVRITPRLVERVWGRTDLAGWYAAPSDSQPIGEAWLTDESCELESGETFGALIERDRHALLGDASAPALVKMLFTAQALSVQVHPTDASARASGVAATGKNECWHVLDATAGAVVEVGFTSPVTPETLRAAIADGSVMGLMARHTVHPGDTVPIKAGTVHAIGAGLVLLEVQDPVQVTYRLYDYGRPRELQVEDGLSVSDLGIADAGAWTAAPAPVLVTSPRWTLERRQIERPATLTPDGTRYHLLVPLTPGLSLDGTPLQQGTAIFIPARCRPTHLAGTGTLAIIHPGPGPTPDLG